METKLSRLLAAAVLGTAAFIAAPALPASAAANTWTCDNLRLLEPPFVIDAVGYTNCTGGDPSLSSGGIVARLSTVRVSCGWIGAGSAPNTISGDFCSRSSA